MTYSMTGKPNTTPPVESVMLSVRVAPSVIDRLDTQIQAVSFTTGTVATRSDVLREAVMIGLRAMERDAKRDKREK